VNEPDLIDYIRVRLRGLGYPEGSIKRDYTTKEEPSPDLVVLGYDDKPLLVIEAKSKLRLALARSQIEHYMMQLNARYGMLTDGASEYSYEKLRSGYIVEIPSIPRSNQVSWRTPTYELRTLKTTASKFQRIADILREQNIPFDDAIVEVAKLLLAKFVDELNTLQEFFVEDIGDNQEYRKLARDRVERLFQRAKDQYPGLFPQDENIRLADLVVARLVGELQSYSIHKSPVVFCQGIDELLRFQTKKLSEAHTPQSVAAFVASLVEPAEFEKILDPACGTGGLLFACLDLFTSTHNIPISECSKRVYGFDINPTLVRLARTYMILRGDHYYNITNQDALSKIEDPTIREITENGGFDIVVLDPPFGLRLHQTKGYELGEGKSNAQSDVLFLERALQLVKIGGRVAILVPTVLLSASGYQYVRSFLRNKARIRAVISLPSESFTETRTSALLIERIQEPTNESYQIFMAVAETYGQLTEVVDAYKRHMLSGRMRTVAVRMGERLNPEYHLTNAPTIGCSLNAIARVRRGKSISLKTHSDHRGIPYVRIADLNRETVSIQNVKRVQRDLPQLDKAKIKENDLLFSIRGTIGKVAIVPRRLEGAIASSNLAILTTKEESVEKKFLLLALQSRYVKDQINRFATGTTIRQLSTNDLGKLRIIIPPNSTQLELVRKVEQLRKESHSKQAEQQLLDLEFEKLLEA